jgi:hypothetical protein
MGRNSGAKDDGAGREGGMCSRHADDVDLR